MSSPATSVTSATSATNPAVAHHNNDDKVLKFTLSGIDTSIANGLRRIILSDIRSVVFRAFPHSDCKIDIQKNTSRLNNEMIKQRLSCVPIHINQYEFPVDKHVVELSVCNTSDHIIYATSEDFKIKNTETETYLHKDVVASIFPKDSISLAHIDLVRLRPNISGHHLGEEIKLSAQLDWGTQGENGAFNSVSTCLYTNTINRDASDKLWNMRKKEMESEKNNDQTIASAEKDWNCLDSHRSYIPNSYDFEIETVGVWDNKSIVRMGCEAMIHRLQNFSEVIQGQKHELIRRSTTTLRDGYDIVMKNEDYTLGKVVEYFLYTDYYVTKRSGGKSFLSFCGFAKPHPHINESVIRIAISQTNQSVNVLDEIVNIVVDACKRGVDTYTAIGSQFE